MIRFIDIAVGAVVYVNLLSLLYSPFLVFVFSGKHYIRRNRSNSDAHKTSHVTYELP